MMIWLIQITSLIFSAALAGCVVSSVGCKARIGFLIYHPVGTRNFAPATGFITDIA